MFRLAFLVSLFLQVSYTLPTLEGGQLMRLTDKATIAAYKPLTPAQPSSGKTLLGVDASLQVKIYDT